MTAKPLLELVQIRKTYSQGSRPLTVLEDVSLRLMPGDLVGLVGMSGCGKSTLLNIAGLLDMPTSGEVLLSGALTGGLSDQRRSALRRQHIGFIFQFHHLLPEFTLLENVLMPLRIQHQLTPETEAYARHLLRRVGLEARQHAFPAQLSGGERQRGAVVRALVHKPSLILADEPTGNLDEENAGEVFQLFLELVRESQAAALLVTHNEAMVVQLPLVYHMAHRHLEGRSL